MFGFEKLDVWQKAIEYADAIYAATRDFPNDERFGLTSQLRRSAVSISSNVAEGSSRASRNDFSRFVQISYGSLMENISQLHIARRQRLLDEAAFAACYAAGEELARMLSGLRAALAPSSGSRP